MDLGVRDIRSLALVCEACTPRFVQHDFICSRLWAIELYCWWRGNELASKLKISELADERTWKAEWSERVLNRLRRVSLPWLTFLSFRLHYLKLKTMSGERAATHSTLTCTQIRTVKHIFTLIDLLFWGHSWLWHCATNRDVAVLAPYCVSTFFFYLHNPCGQVVALWSNQLLTEMCTGVISWGVKVAGALGWQPYQLHVPTVLKSGSLNLPEPSRPVQVRNGTTI